MKYTHTRACWKQNWTFNPYKQKLHGYFVHNHSCYCALVSKLDIKEIKHLRLIIAHGQNFSLKAYNHIKQYYFVYLFLLLTRWIT